jgi:hypothetical protein
MYGKTNDTIKIRDFFYNDYLMQSKTVLKILVLVSVV